LRYKTQTQEAIMKEVTIIGLNIAKNVFQAHGAYQDGGVAFRKKLSRGKVLSFCQHNRHALWHWKHVQVRTIGGVRLAELVTKCD
jgi:hypothetical protein